MQLALASAAGRKDAAQQIREVADQIEKGELDAFFLASGTKDETTAMAATRTKGAYAAVGHLVANVVEGEGWS